VRVSRCGDTFEKEELSRHIRRIPAWRLADIGKRQTQERHNQAYALRLLGEIAARREPPESALAEAHYQQALALAAALALYRAMDMTFWLPQAETALAQVEE
jgi:hypothetical protein